MMTPMVILTAGELVYYQHPWNELPVPQDCLLRNCLMYT